MIDFPSSPTVGDVVTSPDGLSWTWDGSTWLIVGEEGGGGGSGFTYVQDTAPEAAEGETWFNTATGRSFVWVDDGTSTQWVQFAGPPGPPPVPPPQPNLWLTSVAPNPIGPLGGYPTLTCYGGGFVDYLHDIYVMGIKAALSTEAADGLSISTTLSTSWAFPGSGTFDVFVKNRLTLEETNVLPLEVIW